MSELEKENSIFGNKKGAFIVIEGIDASGKTVQTKRLINKLKELNKEVVYADFPAYESKFGKLVAAYLRGDYGKREEIPFEIRCLFYAMDRYQFKKQYAEAITNGKVIVSNRFTQANMGFQPLEYEGNERKKAVKWIEDVESRLPQADLVFVLNVSPSTAYELTSHKDLRDYLKGLKKDIHEESLDLQTNAAQNYLQIAKERDNWVVIACMNPDGLLKSKEEIFSEIWSHVEKIIN